MSRPPKEQSPVELSVDHSPFHRLIGLQLVRAEPGVVEMRLPWRDDFRRAEDSDWYHGGILSALIDIAGDYAVASRLGRWVPTIDLRVDYLRPALRGDLTAVARAVKVGRTVGVADVELRDAKGAMVAIGRCAYSTSG
ncbi:MAG TPA: PaaI family thioesterase [Methylomirabilota bacterium]|nr:PaaI family thioesterase [Methylomirabilota bacterium]